MLCEIYLAQGTLPLDWSLTTSAMYFTSSTWAEITSTTYPTNGMKFILLLAPMQWHLYLK